MEVAGSTDTTEVVLAFGLMVSSRRNMEAEGLVIAMTWDGLRCE